MNLDDGLGNHSYDVFIIQPLSLLRLLLLSNSCEVGHEFYNKIDTNNNIALDFVVREEVVRQITYKDTPRLKNTVALEDASICT